MEHRPELTDFATLTGIAALISLGKTLRDDPTFNVKVTCGRMICSGGLGGSAAFVGFFAPGTPLYVQMGLACALATLGADVFTSIIKIKLGVTR